MGRVGQPFPQPLEGLLLAGATGRSPDRAAGSRGSQCQPPGIGIARPMLFEPQALAPGLQLRHPGNVIPPQADPRRSRAFTIMKLYEPVNNYPTFTSETYLIQLLP